MPHRVKSAPPLPPPPVLDEEMERAVAETSQAFATPSRIRILVRLWRGPASVSTLAADVGMEQSAVSHQLRILRDLRLVDVDREGRSSVYRLRDDHVAIMLKEAIYHVEHLRLEGRRREAVTAGERTELPGRKVEPEVTPVG
ncbi:MAG TPA: metalloregulator ArsR/SmtB family transcription factor [Candidatus Limnocylindrales bacterium]|nr:metalloregulator ArsR/SmtB family transcription factor [Candidatus Limnocylindrales bacterium]